MEKKLTKRQTLEICRELWMWLYETGSELKKSWHGWMKYGLMDTNCPCCEYAISKKIEGAKRGRCVICPLSNYAWTKSVVRGYCTSMDGTSFYRLWMFDTSDEVERSVVRSYWAAWMVDACDRALEDLK